MANNKYSTDDICAVVVTYNPDSVLLDNISSLLTQVGSCLVVDNGTTQDQYLNQAINDYSVSVIKLGENKGIAAALNVGLDYCVKNNFPLILTVDQDSILEKDAVSSLLEVITEEAVSVGINWDGRCKHNEYPEYLITSGNLVLVSAATSVGGYDERLFIDSVDFDFSLRLIDNGFKLIKVAGAQAKHSIGEKQGDGTYFTHSVSRYYYIYRNHFYIIKRYCSTHRWLCVKKQIVLFLDVIRIVLFDRDRKEKLSMIGKGYNDSKLLFES